ncbi:TPA: hypothetical protein DCG86_01520, partial [Candidatus Marinimicrobia bacterium]|nr:hypothetical protein [Candidatus Neomarinimicrobiota bacterium]
VVKGSRPVRINLPPENAYPEYAQKNKDTYTVFHHTFDLLHNIKKLIIIPLALLQCRCTPSGFLSPGPVNS